MAVNIKDLCRLCGKHDEFSKNLMDKPNKNVRKVIEEYIHIKVSESDKLPTKVCLCCEEKMVAFQVFVLDCKKVQDTLNNLCADIPAEPGIVKEEEEIGHYGVKVKTEFEVKYEFTAEDLVSAISNQTSMRVLEDNDADPDDPPVYDICNNAETMEFVREDHNDLDDNISIAILKKKKELLKRKPKSKLNLMDYHVALPEFIKIICHICSEETSSWGTLRLHCYKEHKTKPQLHCSCGYIINSQSTLYKHVRKHKSDVNINAKLNISDYIKFNCSICSKKFCSWYKLKGHCDEEHHMKTIVQCSCGVPLKSKSAVYKHVQDHKNPNLFHCDVCPHVARNTDDLEKHKRRHMPKEDKRFECSSCAKVFKCKELLRSHVKSHIPLADRKLFPCDICDLKFTTRVSLSAHKRVVHDKIKSFICDLCGYSCGTNHELRQHRAIHSDLRAFRCTKCPKTFKTYSNLSTHLDTHEDTSYACYVCGRVLNSRRTLRKHMLVHEDRCKHVCSYCNKAFKRRQTLKVHLHSHTGDKPLSCQWCDERFAYASTLRSHRHRFHPDKLTAAAPASLPAPLPAPHPAPLAAPLQHAEVGAYTVYSQDIQQDYIKNDLASIGLAKNEVESI